MAADPCFTYILRCQDASLYTGWTNNPQKRLQAHNAGKGAAYTRSRRPVRLVYYEVYETRQEAMSREWAIKHMTRVEKCHLIQDFQGLKPAKGSQFEK